MLLHIPRLTAGRGALAALAGELAQMRARKPLLVTDRVMARLGHVRRTVAAAGEDASVVMFDDVRENPVFADADRGAAAFAEQGCDSVIALGGGSVIDAAKYVALIAVNGGRVSHYAGAPETAIRRCAPLIAIPTTAGTGSEASPDAGIHPHARAASVGMSSPMIVPDAALLDPKLTLTLPSRLTAATGVDALSHCIEGYFSRRRTPLSDLLALDGIRRVWRSIERATADGGDLSAREDLMIAAFAGGVSIGMGLGPAHAVAIACSDQDFPHGILSGIGLVCALDLAARADPARARDIADAMNLRGEASLSEAVAEKLRALGLPSTLGALGYSMKDLAAAAGAAHRSPFNLWAPYHPSAQDYERMLRISLT